MQGDSLDLINLAGRKLDHLQNLEVRASLHQNKTSVLIVTKPQQEGQDPYLRQLASRMQGHLDSIQDNKRQMAGVEDALLRTRSRVDEVLYDGLDHQQYTDLAA